MEEVGDVGRGCKSLYPSHLGRRVWCIPEWRLGGVSVAGAASEVPDTRKMALRCILRPQGRGLGRLWGWHQIVYDTVNLSSLISSLKTPITCLYINPRTQEDPISIYLKGPFLVIIMFSAQ